MTPSLSSWRFGEVLPIQPLYGLKHSRAFVGPKDTQRALRRNQPKIVTVHSSAVEKVVGSLKQSLDEQQKEKATRVQVERSSHLPVSREEAWRALQDLIPNEDWQALVPVLVSLESIYRAEYQQLGEEVLSALRSANEALEEIKPLEDAWKPSRRKRELAAAKKADAAAATRSADSDAPASGPGPAWEAMSSSGSPIRADSSNGSALKHVDANDAEPTSPAEASQNGSGPSSSQSSRSAIGRDGNGTASSSGSVTNNGKFRYHSQPAAVLDMERVGRGAVAPSAASEPQGLQLERQSVGLMTLDDDSLIEASASEHSSDHGGNGNGAAVAGRNERQHNGARAGNGSAATARYPAHGPRSGFSQAAGTVPDDWAPGEAFSTSAPIHRATLQSLDEEDEASGRSLDGRPTIGGDGDLSPEELVRAAGVAAREAIEDFAPVAAEAVAEAAAVTVAGIIGSMQSGEEAGGDQSGPQDGASAGPPAPVVVLPGGAIDYERLSRREYDQQRRESVDERDLVDPAVADARFMRLFTLLCRKAHFVNFSGRDAAMSRSFNATSPEQLFIKADTASLDGELVAAAASVDAGLPEEAKSLLVYKRGYGQIRKRGRMLLAKLDFLQLVVVQRVATVLRDGLGGAYGAVRDRVRGALGNSGDESEAGATRGGEERERERDDETEETLEEASRAEMPAPRRKRALERVTEAGLAPVRMLAGGGLVMALSSWGVLPGSRVPSLREFDEAWKPAEPPRLAPTYLERISIGESFRGGFGSVVESIEVVEPTFQELLVLYRQKVERSWLDRVRERVLGLSAEQKAQRYAKRPGITLRIYKDIPVPSWKVVFPAKLLQFRPLDGLRADLLTIAGLVSVVAQAKYDSIILEVVTLVSIGVFLSRSIGGYLNMNKRYQQLVSQMLADTTIAGQEGAVELLTNSAGLQQFGQVALAYLVLRQQWGAAGEGAEGLSAAVEDMLDSRFRVKVRFDGEEALAELERLGLLVPPGDPAGSGKNGSASNSGGRVGVLAPDQAFLNLKAHWDSLLLQRVRSMQALEARPEGVRWTGGV